MQLCLHACLQQQMQMQPQVFIDSAAPRSDIKKEWGTFRSYTFHGGEIEEHFPLVFGNFQTISVSICYKIACFQKL